MPFWKEIKCRKPLHTSLDEAFDGAVFRQRHAVERLPYVQNDHTMDRLSGNDKELERISEITNAWGGGRTRTVLCTEGF